MRKSSLDGAHCRERCDSSPATKVLLDVGAHRAILTVATVAGITTAPACVAEPRILLTGQWGGRGVFLDARESEVQLWFPCMKASLPELSLDAAGHFEGTARNTWVSFGFDPAARLHVSGDVTGADMTMAVTYVSRRYTALEPEGYTLRLGAAPDFSGYGCLG
jgi:hypothetical protein